MQVHIRDIIPDDIKTIKPWLIDKANAKWLDPFFDNEALQDVQLAFFLLRKDKKIFLVLYDDIPVGIMGLNYINKTNQSAELWNILGNMKYRRKGITKLALYLTLQKAFYELKLHSITAWVVAGNIMKGCFGKLNFRTIGIQRECHLIDGALKDRVLFDIVINDFKKISTDDIFELRS